MLERRAQALAAFRTPETLIHSLRFGVTEMTALTWLPDFVAEIRATYPGITLQPEVEQSADLFASLCNGAVNFIVVPDSFRHPGIDSIPLASVQTAWMCSPELYQGPSMIRLQELTAFNILTQGDRSGSGIIFGRWLRESGVEPPNVIRSNSVIALVGLTLAAVGVSYLARNCFQPLVDQRRLRLIETDPPLPAVTYAIMFRPGEPQYAVDVISRMARSCCDFSRTIEWGGGRA